MIHDSMPRATWPAFIAGAFCAAALLSPPGTHAAEPALAIAPDAPGLKWSGCPPFMPTGCEIAVLHGDPTKPNVDVFFRVPAQAVVPSHWHTSAERMILVAGEMHVTYEGQDTAVLKPGTYAYGPPTRPHRALCAGSEPCVLFIAFERPLDAVPSGKPSK